MDIMQNMEHKTPLANNHISVDCVVIGFDGEQLKVLLIKRVGEEQGEIFHDMKLPGSLNVLYNGYPFILPGGPDNVRYCRYGVSPGYGCGCERVDL